MHLFSKGRNVPECLNYHSCGISSVAWLTTILEVNEGHDDTRPDALAVWLLLHLTHECKQAFAEGDEIRLRQAHRSPQRHSSKRIRIGSASARCTDRSPGR